ncbi:MULTISPECIES: zinc-dependent alcohol dehydrogenase [Spirosoma]|uniref:Alcohol dehydrogenase n=1 Tax=Spirosoma fluviale TaxID=1597977 RepID=A0A286GA68_9BACT|nr:MULTISPECIES: zinc-dependent alcohol dehydrogenase [Spirosoma]MCX6219152.1 glutathione-dependent formaldehyde dehydrogenase [Spirosoma sp.]SOD92411.1 alcohol dehydrogenase [Spirosoma fluviale]
MKAAVFHKIGDIQVDTVDDPRIEQSRDAIIRVTSTAICGSDLHIYDGFIPQLKNEVLGHEFMGIVEDVGSEVTNLKKGDRVVVPFTVACGKCYFCQKNLQMHCENSNPEHYGPDGGLLTEKGGGLFGYTDLYGGYNGGQAEYVRVPYADYGLHTVPESLKDEQVLFLTDIFPTGWSSIEWGELKGGETVAIFGSGPVGLMAQKSAWIQGAARVIAIDPVNYRLEKARRVNNVETLNPDEVDVIEAIRQMTNGRGADLCVDAVGMEADRSLLEKAKAVINFEKGTPKVLELCFQAVRRGGIVSVVGVYGTPFDNISIGRMFDKGITVRFGQSFVHKNMSHLLDLVVQGKVVLDDIISHTLPLADASKAYDMFKKKQDDCTKVVLKP